MELSLKLPLLSSPLLSIALSLLISCFLPVVSGPHGGQ